MRRRRGGPGIGVCGRPPAGRAGGHCATVFARTRQAMVSVMVRSPLVRDFVSTHRIRKKRFRRRLSQCIFLQACRTARCARNEPATQHHVTVQTSAQRAAQRALPRRFGAPCTRRPGSLDARHTRVSHRLVQTDHWHVICIVATRTRQCANKNRCSQRRLIDRRIQPQRGNTCRPVFIE